MKVGRYTVQSFNGKDAILIREDGLFEILTKGEFPISFDGAVYVGDVVVVNTITGMQLERATQLSRIRTLQRKEEVRRALYGRVGSIERVK